MPHKPLPSSATQRVQAPKKWTFKKESQEPVLKRASQKLGDEGDAEAAKERVAQEVREREERRKRGVGELSRKWVRWLGGGSGGK